MLSWHKIRVVGYDPIHCLIDDDTELINIGKLIDLSLEAEEIFLEGDKDAMAPQSTFEITE